MDEWAMEMKATKNVMLDCLRHAASNDPSKGRNRPLKGKLVPFFVLESRNANTHQDNDVVINTCS